MGGIRSRVWSANESPRFNLETFNELERAGNAWLQVTELELSHDGAKLKRTLANNKAYSPFGPCCALPRK